VGLVRSAADWWLRADRPMIRGELAANLTDLVWSGLSAVGTPQEET
jgi:Tetracyclin repressor-like, C-terminal domain